MKKYIYGVGTLALALVMSGLPAAALADNNSGEGQDGAQAQVTSASVTATSVQGEKPQVVSSEEGSEADQSTMTEAAQNMREQLKQRAEITREMIKNSAELLTEGTTTSALSFEQLKQSIEMRSQELDQEEASSSPEVQDIMKNANPVRLAVHSLLASKDLLGGIGQQVSEIAQQMNDSVATTTSAEAQIKSRGFFAKLLFGGDSAAADVIKNEVAQNQQRIDDLTKLLGQVNVPADIQVTLQAQITALQDAQARLQALAEKEQKMWGLFSWRF